MSTFELRELLVAPQLMDLFKLEVDLCVIEEEAEWVEDMMQGTCPYCLRDLDYAPYHEACGVDSRDSFTDDSDDDLPF